MPIQGQMGMGPQSYYQYSGYQQPNQMEKVASTLTQEEIDRLRKKTSQFTISISQDERLRGICNHRTADGSADTLTQDPITGELKCQVCGYVFDQVSNDLTKEELERATKQITDILQTIKLMYIDLPTEAAREYFQIIPLIDKIPQLFEFAAKNLSKHINFNWDAYNNNQTIYGKFNALQNMFGLFNSAPYQQPMGGFQQAPYQQPMMGGFQQAPYQQPMGGFQQAPYQQPMMGGANAFGYPGASQQNFMNPPAGYQPQSPEGFAFTPNQNTTPAQTTSTPEPTTVTENTKVEM